MAGTKGVDNSNLRNVSLAGESEVSPSSPGKQTQWQTTAQKRSVSIEEASEKYQPSVEDGEDLTKISDRKIEMASEADGADSQFGLRRNETARVRRREKKERHDGSGVITSGSERSAKESKSSSPIPAPRSNPMKPNGEPSGGDRKNTEMIENNAEVRDVTSDQSVVHNENGVQVEDDTEQDSLFHDERDVLLAECRALLGRSKSADLDSSALKESVRFNHPLQERLKKYPELNMSPKEHEENLRCFEKGVEDITPSVGALNLMEDNEVARMRFKNSPLHSVYKIENVYRSSVEPIISKVREKSFISKISRKNFGSSKKKKHPNFVSEVANDYKTAKAYVEACRGKLKTSTAGNVKIAEENLIGNFKTFESFNDDLKKRRKLMNEAESLVRLFRKETTKEEVRLSVSSMPDSPLEYSQFEKYVEDWNKAYDHRESGVDGGVELETLDVQDNYKSLKYGEFRRAVRFGREVNKINAYLQYLNFEIERIEGLMLGLEETLASDYLSLKTAMDSFDKEQLEGRFLGNNYLNEELEKAEEMKKEVEQVYDIVQCVGYENEFDDRLGFIRSLAKDVSKKVAKERAKNNSQATSELSRIEGVLKRNIESCEKIRECYNEIKVSLGDSSR